MRKVHATLDANPNPTLFGQFIAGIHGVWNTFTPEITDPDGNNTIQRVEFTLGSLDTRSLYRPEGPWPISVWGATAFDVGRLSGDTTLTVVAYDAQGNRSQPWLGTVKVIPLPSWVDADSSRFVTGNRSHYALTGWRPGNLSVDFTIPSSVPFLGGKNSGFHIGLLTSADVGIDGGVLVNSSRGYVAIGFTFLDLDLRLFKGTIDLAKVFGGISPRWPKVGFTLPSFSPRFRENLEIDWRTPTWYGELKFDVEAFNLINWLGKGLAESGKEHAYIYGGKYPFPIGPWPVSVEAALYATIGASFAITPDFSGETILQPVSYIIPRLGPMLKVKANLVDIGAASVGIYAKGTIGFNYQVGYIDNVPGIDRDCFIDVVAYLGGEIKIGPVTIPIAEFKWFDRKFGKDFGAGESEGLKKDGTILCSPDVVTLSDGRLLAAYVARNDGNWDSDIVFRTYDGDWSSVASISHDGDYIDLSPSLSVGGDGVVTAMWSRIMLSDSQIANATLDEIFSAQEVVYAQFDGTAWSAPVRLTSNEQPDGNVSVAHSSDGHGMSMWVTNTSGGIQALDGNEIAYSVFDGSSWTSMSNLTADSAGDRSVDVTYLPDGHAVAAWIHEVSANDLQQIPHFSVWDGSYWTSAAPIPGATVGDLRTVQVAALNDSRLVAMWAEVTDNGTVLWSALRSSDGVWSNVEIAASGLSLVDGLQLESNDNDIVFALFHGIGASDEIVTMSRDFRQQNSTWTTMAPVSHGDAIERMAAATVMQDDNLFVVFAEEAMPDGSVPPADGSENPVKFATVFKGPDMRFVAESLVLADPTSPAEQSNALVAHAVNWGHNVSGPFEVEFYDGDPNAGGTRIGAAVSVEGLSPDGEVTVTSDGFELQAGNHTFYAVISPVSGESIVDNNVISALVEVAPRDVTGPKASLAVPDIGKFREGDGSLTILFDEPIEYIAESDISLVEDEAGMIPPDRVYLLPDGDAATLIIEGGLRKGHYTLKVFDSILDVAGNQLDGDEDGTPTGTFSTRFPIVPGVTTISSQALATSESGAAATFEVVLDTPPVADVWITAVSSDASEGIVVSDQLEFTAENWNVPQSVTMNGVDDSVDDGNITYHVYFLSLVSDDPDYAGVVRNEVEVMNADDDTGGIMILPSNGRIVAEDPRASISLQLTSEPTAEVTITLSPSQDTAVVDPAVVRFGPDNWHVPQNVWVGSSQTSGARDFSIDATLQSGDLNYQGSIETIVIVDLFPWNNAGDSLDVNNDSDLSPLDALLVINYLNTADQDRLKAVGVFLDVSGDESVSPLDALLVINFLNSGEGEGEQSADSGSGGGVVGNWRLAS